VRQSFTRERACHLTNSSGFLLSLRLPKYPQGATHLKEDEEFRYEGIACALLIGIGIPAFLFGPVLFGGNSLNNIPFWALVVSLVSGLFGAWLLLVSCLASESELNKVLEPCWADVGVVLFLPYMLFIGTRSVWRRLVGGRDIDRGEP
jgi:hypothetical protein